MKRNVRLKMCVSAMVALFMPLALSAQTDRFFSTDNGGGSRGVPPGNYPVGNGENPFSFDDIGGGGSAPKNEGPVGSGLLIMVAAGAGYLELKRKEEK